MRGLPLGVRWFLSVVVLGGLAIGAFALLHNSDKTSQDQQDASALIRANIRARELINKDQAPHSAGLGPGASPAAALEAAIRGDLDERVRRHQLRGPSQRVRCRPVGTAAAGPQAYRCVATAAGFPYPFLATVDARRGVVTWCKSDPPPPGQPGIPVSRRCLP